MELDRMPDKMETDQQDSEARYITKKTLMSMESVPERQVSVQ